MVYGFYDLVDFRCFHFFCSFFARTLPLASSAVRSVAFKWELMHQNTWMVCVYVCVSIDGEPVECNVIRILRLLGVMMANKFYGPFIRWNAQKGK